jgi:hypothetical protein
MSLPSTSQSGYPLVLGLAGYFRSRASRPFWLEIVNRRVSRGSPERAMGSEAWLISVMMRFTSNGSRIMREMAAATRTANAAVDAHASRINH